MPSALQPLCQAVGGPLPQSQPEGLQNLRSTSRPALQKLQGLGYPRRERRYDGFKHIMMRRIRLGLAAVLVVALTVPAFADKRADAKAQVAFGRHNRPEGPVEGRDAAVRKRDGDSTRRMRRPGTTSAIGYEQLGRFEDAKKCYESALELDPKDEYIKSNYMFFREIYDRQSRAKGK